MKIQLVHSFKKIVSMENLFLAWQEFSSGKSGTLDVQIFVSNLIENIVELHNDLSRGTYRHEDYERFTISDPKPRIIHKAIVRDRLLHHAIHRVLYPFFDRTFISDSFSCRTYKGTHAAIRRFYALAHKVSQNNTRTAWILKCDIKKFFHSIDHQTLLNILAQQIKEDNTVRLLEQVIRSFSSQTTGRGLPLGNLTSQLFANIYMNVFDQFVKHKLRARYYIRYADDFLILSENRNWLEKQLLPIQGFLQKNLKLSIHPDKIYLKTLSSGMDFLGWVNFPNHRILRGATMRKMFRKIKAHPTKATLNSYLGLLKHGNTRKLQEAALSNYLLNSDTPVYRSEI